MASDIATATAELTPEPAAKTEAAPAVRRRRRRRRRLSPLTLRILAVNILALGLLGLGLLYLGQYQQSLVSAQLDALKTQGQISRRRSARAPSSIPSARASKCCRRWAAR